MLSKALGTLSMRAVPPLPFNKMVSPAYLTPNTFPLMMQTIFALLCGISTLVDGAHLPIFGQSALSLSPRSSILGDTGPLNNLNNMEYYTTVTLGGRSYKVLIDTGRYVRPLYYCPSESTYDTLLGRAALIYGYQAILYPIRRTLVYVGM